MKNIFALLLLAMVFAGCKKESDDTPEPVNVSKDIKFFLLSKNNVGKMDTVRIDLTLAGDSVIGVVPTLSNQKSFALSFEPSNANLKVDGAAQKSGVTVNDFTRPVTYTYTNAKGEVRQLKVAITNFTGLPIFYINTAGPIVSKDIYVTGQLEVNTNGQFEQPAAPYAMEIRGRGNTTWEFMPKKPYRIKLNSKASILGLTPAKNWVLLANYADKTLLRNVLAFDIGHHVSADFTPHYRFVEVVLNGEYIGSYTLTEQVQINPGRVDIREMTPDDEDGEAITGGYLLEVDQLKDADRYFTTSRNIHLSIKSPDNITDKQFAYITNYIKDFETVLFSPDFADPTKGYAKYIKTESFINWYIVNELMKNNDAQDFSSIFYYKDMNGKLGMGPVWDFDIAGANLENSPTLYPVGWWVRDADWFYRLFQDPAFKARARERWDAVKPYLNQVVVNLENNAHYLNLSQKQNFKRWDILNVKVWSNPHAAGSYQGEIEYLKTWLEARINWMDQNM